MSIIELKEKILLNLIFPIADFVMGTCAMKWYKKIQYLETLSKDELMYIKENLNQYHSGCEGIIIKGEDPRIVRKIFLYE